METWIESDVSGYLVSSEGRMAKLMSLTPSKNGYVQLSIPTAKGAKTRIRRYLHDLILTAFVGPRPEGAVARHLNDIPTDNRVDNLAWGSRSENQFDAFRNGRRTRKSECPYRHPLSGWNVAKDKDGTIRCRACRAAKNAARRAGAPCSSELRDKEFLRLQSIHGSI